MAYTHLTLNDLGCGNEGRDSEADAMGFIFDDNAKDISTFDTGLEYDQAFDGLGQHVVEGRIERLDGLGYAGLGAGATTLDNDETQLPLPPEGESWVYKGPNSTGVGHDWESQPDSFAADGQNLFNKLMQNKPMAGAGAVAVVGILWWLFVRKPKKGA